MTRSAEPKSSPWKPRTWATATAAPRYGSSPAPSTIRPQRGSRAMSTIGANAQWMPTARASRAATACPASMVAGSQEAAMAIGTGRIVRRPWITSKPNKAGMPSRLPSIASRWSRLVSAGSVTNNNEPDHASGQRTLDHDRLLGEVGVQRLLDLLRRGQIEVEVLRQLARLFRQAQLGQQTLDAFGDSGI